MLSRRIAETPLAVIDLETTGLVPGGDRIVEMSIVRVEPDGAGQIVLDTLINPQRPMASTDIHGIRDEDVTDAPTFADIAGDVVGALQGAALASYNVYFDAPFLQHELYDLGVPRLPPRLCLMYLRPMLGLGKRCSLRDACHAHGLDYMQSHQASSDALAAARLWPICVAASHKAGISTFSELAQTTSHKFVRSWDDDFLLPPLGAHLRTGARQKSRSAPDATSSIYVDSRHREASLHEYTEALKVVLSDLVISPEEQAYLSRKRTELRVSSTEQRAIHARIFADILRACADDRIITDDENKLLRSLHRCLAALGWAPGL